MKLLPLFTIFILIATQTIAQQIPRKIDIGNEFDKIEEYNEHIRSANRHRFNSFRDLRSRLIMGTIGLAAVGYGAATIEEALSTDGSTAQSIITPVVAGVGIGLLIPSFDGSYRRKLKRLEREEIIKANNIYKSLSE